MHDILSTKIIENANSTAEIMDGDIFYLYYHKYAMLTVKDFEEGIADYEKLSEGRKMKILVEIGEFSSSTSKARKFASNNNPSVTREAIVIKDFSQRMIAQLYVALHKKKHPKRIFKSKEKALNWIKTK
jgi:hypothetical protein